MPADFSRRSNAAGEGLTGLNAAAVENPASPEKNAGAREVIVRRPRDGARQVIGATSRRTSAAAAAGVAPRVIREILRDVNTAVRVEKVDGADRTPGGQFSATPAASSSNVAPVVKADAGVTPQPEGLKESPKGGNLLRGETKADLKLADNAGTIWSRESATHSSSPEAADKSLVVPAGSAAAASREQAVSRNTPIENKAPAAAAASSVAPRVAASELQTALTETPARAAAASAPAAVVTPVEKVGAEMTAGVSVSADKPAGSANNFAAAAAQSGMSPALPGQTPFGGTPAAVPGVVEAENYDEGGEGVAYHDTGAGNTGGYYRTNTDVDIDGSAGNGASNGHDVGWFAASEWLEYTVNVAKTDTYTLEARVAHPGAGGTIHVEVDGVDKTGPLSVPDTGGWFTWKNVSKPGVQLTAGQHVVRVVGDANGVTGYVANLDSLRFVPSTPPELVAYWRFDAGTGSVAADSSGKGNTGTLQGATWVAGKGGAGALGFNGAGGQVAVNASAALRNVTNNFTVSFWAKPRAAHEIDPEGSNALHYGTSGQKYAIGAEQGEGMYGTADHAGVGVSVGTNGVSVYEHSGNYMPASLVHQATINDWTHVAVVYENRVPRLYVNGAYVKTGAKSPKGILHIVPQHIGSHGYGSFDGEMDEVKIFNGAMNDAQVAALAAPPAELIAHWKLDEPFGNTAEDATGKGSTGKLQGPTRRPGKVGGGALSFDGVNDAVIPERTPAVSDVTNNFTYSFWVKPRAAHEIDPEGSLAAHYGTSGQKYAIGAMHGAVFTGEGMGYNHAGAGVSVGTNGVSVYEHTGNYMPATLVHQASLTDWTHVTVVYENRVPRLYVNGAYVKTGAAGSVGFVHAVPGDIGGHSYGYFDGELDDVRIYKGVLAAEEISALASLVAHWKFNEEGGPLAVDETGNNNTGTLQRATRSVGKDGTGALSFNNGANASVPVNASATLKNVTNNFTYSFWVKPRAAHEIDPEGSLAAHYGTSGQRYAIGAMHGAVFTGEGMGYNHAGAGVSVGTNGVSVYEHTGNYMPATLVHQATINDWTHVAVVYENRVPRLYVNGAYVKTGAAGSVGFVHAVPGDIGGHSYGYFDGELDDVRVYSRALTAAEVQTLPVLNALNAAPSVAVTSPYNGAVFNAPVNVELAADANDDGTLRKVEFFANGTLVATKTEAPFRATWTNVPGGSYSITARATDDAGVSATSAAVQITVNPQPDSGVVPPAGSRLITAEVVALDQVITYNRLGAVNPAGMMYALKRDVVPVDPSKGLVPGNVQLRKDKRPRPLVLRMNVGDRLQVKFQNLLSPSPADDNQPHTRTASVHVTGLQLVNNILDDGSNVGANQSSLVAPGGTATYTFYAEREGNHLLYSTAATTGGEGDGGSLAVGLFGSVNVEPRGAEYYRSQVTAQELAAATTGRTPLGQPIINYDARYGSGPRTGQYILRMLDDNLNIIHSDLNAIITGPNKGRFPAGTFRPNATEPDREQPFREFTVVYHDEIKAVQAFPQFEDPVLSHTLHSVRDGFAINYGTGGIGAEILANRLGVGPMANCAECKYEEFFLSAWTVGDPAMIVDKPANTTDGDGNLITGAKATKALYPDDPSNVHHSYLNDHVKMRVVHAGPKEHHVHHLHAHQWLRTPDSDNSSYLDSQAFGPGYSFTTEITHGGSGNRNKTVGDSIFHCHFYPHFAQGMWELWRVHDVFEEGTQLGSTGIPVAGARALPDGEIAAGTPIPALVPLPTIAMPLMPTAAFKGFPFYIPGVAGHRPPKPPLDTVDDGGLPRHIITAGAVRHHKEHLPAFSFDRARLDFDKLLETAVAKPIAETGTPEEVEAMKFHGLRTHGSYTPGGAAANFITNGLPRKSPTTGLGAQPGAPYADPCVDDGGNAIGNTRVYKAANLQLDVKLNKAGWHFPQSRIGVLWEDVAATRTGARPPEPLFFRSNTNDCITFYHTNLVPHVYEQDDFQVRTPTDIMGQHIHLVKFDVTSSDGSGNGWNYEDGTMSPGEVQERVRAIRKQNGCAGVDRGDTRDGTFTCPVAKAHPFFGLSGEDKDGNGVDDWLGAQTTVQRWFADNVLNNNGVDRTLRTVFTHDHFGPSTHQQAGFYAGLVIEPQGSTWRHNETGQLFYTRPDGGPTSWQAAISTPTEHYREFLLEFSDFQLAYKAGGGVNANGVAVADPANVINPPAKKEIPLSRGNWLLEPAPQCPGGAPLPCPEAVSAADVGTMSVNYRNEPLALRVREPNGNTQAAGEQGDLSHAFRSNVTRADTRLNSQPSFYPALTKDVQPGDPFTPLLRTYEDDKVQVRVLVGGFEEGHNFGVHGIKWLFEPDDPNSGYRNNQMMGISEHYEFVVPRMAKNTTTTDYLYQPGAATDDAWNGLWGLMRSYNQTRTDLYALPNNPNGHGPAVSNVGDFNGVCPRTAPVRRFDVTAVSAALALPGGTLVYNPRTSVGGKLHDPTAIIYVRSSDLDASGRLLTNAPEPLILRANAGDCIELTLTNSLPAGPPDLDGYSTLPMLVEKFNNNQLAPSPEVGLHPQLLHYDVLRSNGANVGFNPVQTVKPGMKTTYQWYAGNLTIDPATGVGTASPVEFGAVNLISSDPIKHASKGAIGALVVEPQGATWIEDANSRAQATVSVPANGVTTSFREFVLMFQNDVNLRFGSRFDAQGRALAVPNTAEAEDPEDSGQKAFNYRSEPLWKRMGFEPDTHLSCGEDEDGTVITRCTRNFDFTDVLSNSQVGGDPVTPVFTASAGQPVRMRVLMPGGHARNNVFQVHGHIWEEEPYTNESRTLGSNPLSEWKGSQFGIGPGSHFDFLLKNGAGGFFRVRGDYLYRSFQSFQFDGGLWGIFRVQ